MHRAEKPLIHVAFRHNRLSAIYKIQMRRSVLKSGEGGIGEEREAVAGSGSPSSGVWGGDPGPKHVCNKK